MAGRQPLVSVVMSMRNASATVRDTIRSLQWQTLGDWELVLLDDGSTDGSVSVVQSMKDDRIHLYGDSSRKGLAARLNEAVALARGRFIARIDADDICFPARLEKQVRYLEDHPEIDLLASRAAVFAGRDLIGLMPVGTDHPDIMRQAFRGFSFPHPTWCGRAEWYRANPYDGALGKTQDQDLLLRTCSHSTFAGMPDVLVGYRQQKLDIGKLLRGRFIFMRSLWRHGRALGPPSSVIGGIAMQAAKGAADVAILSLGLNRWGQLRRLEPIPRSMRDEWPALCDRLQSSGP
ncbi:MAG TPA: glycosyltransferase family A protein [Pseudolabrys sp.]|nr:glycosyltransferase family A protein [Pseudolabrys sp.]